jgi:hypothetical protein
MISKNILLILVALAVFHLKYVDCKQHAPNRTNHDAADILIFSFNRPMQLYAVLESVHKYFSHLNKIYVLYRTSTLDYDTAYDQLRKIFSHVRFVKQGSSPRSDFKPLLLKCFFDSQAEYLMFSVDDDIVKDYVDIYECTAALKKSNAYGFYLRCGINITTGYGADIQFPVPPYTEIKPNILKFYFKDGADAWGYPNNVDMTIYPKIKIESFLKNATYSSPNTLESLWSRVANLNDYGLCFKTSKMFTLPLNIVQQDWWVPNENSFTADELLQKWKEGLAIDINQFFQVNNNCAFMGYIPNFVKRDNLKWFMLR